MVLTSSTTLQRLVVPRTSPRQCRWRGRKHRELRLDHRHTWADGVQTQASEAHLLLGPFGQPHLESQAAPLAERADHRASTPWHQPRAATVLRPPARAQWRPEEAPLFAQRRALRQKRKSGIARSEAAACVVWTTSSIDSDVARSCWASCESRRRAGTPPALSSSLHSRITSNEAPTDVNRSVYTYRSSTRKDEALPMVREKRDASGSPSPPFAVEWGGGSGGPSAPLSMASTIDRPHLASSSTRWAFRVAPPATNCRSAWRPDSSRASIP
eukprot:scaffold139316_cov31-Tisochrysis_lutea.AAC.4